MLGQIIANTPLWVWALLAFLIYRGMMASVDREIAFRKVFIIPLVMLALSIQGIASSFGPQTGAMQVWLACVAAAGAIAWFASGRNQIIAHPERGVVFQRGSWRPLTLMMGIFFTKYVVAVTLARHPDYRQDAGFVMAACALYGMFNGIFIGRLLRIISAYRRAGTWNLGIGNAN